MNEALVGCWMFYLQDHILLRRQRSPGMSGKSMMEKMRHGLGFQSKVCTLSSWIVQGDERDELHAGVDEAWVGF